MKYLLVFLLLCSLSKAQSVTYDDILEYQEACYNDSSLQCFNIYMYGKGITYVPCAESDMDLGFNPAFRGTTELWIHSQPTFEGFIEFIKVVKYRRLLQMMLKTH